VLEPQPLSSFPGTAGAAGNSPEVRQLAEEVVAHLRQLAGADALLAAYGAAREAVRAQRGERKRRAAMQVGH
jgi:U3 small nucleolar RNA-associated protein 20